jgi:hypothetical protein
MRLAGLGVLAGGADYQVADAVLLRGAGLGLLRVDRVPESLSLVRVVSWIYHRHDDLPVVSEYKYTIHRE